MSTLAKTVQWTRRLGSFGWAVRTSAFAFAVGCSGPDVTGLEPSDDWGADGEGLGPVEQALSGIVDFPQPRSGTSEVLCTTAQINTITAAATRARQHITSGAMVTCMREHYTTATNGDSVEEVIDRMKAALPAPDKTHSFCALLEPAALLAQAPVNVTDEDVDFDVDFLNANATTAGVGKVASVLLHEVAHNKGYNHGLGEVPSNSSWYDFTINKQIEACSLSISNNTFESSYTDSPVPVGNGTPLRLFSRASLLSSVGGLGGQIFQVQCASQRFARGLVGRSGARIDQVGMSCTNAAGTLTPVNTALNGGTGGGPFTKDCGSGNLMVGMSGAADDLVNKLAPICQPASNVAAASTAGYTSPTAVGTDTGSAFGRVCPPGMAVHRIYGRSGALVDRLRLECEKVNKGTSQILASPNFPQTGNVTSTTAFYRDYCPAGSVLRAMGGRGGAEVDRLSGVCGEILVSGGQLTGPSFLAGLEGAGGFGGSYGTKEFCPVNQALIGITISTGTGIASVTGQCANVSQWGNLQLAESQVTKSNLDVLGLATATSTTDTCPRGTFLGGWDAGAGFTPNFNSDSVHTLKPVCFDPRL